MSEAIGARSPDIAALIRATPLFEWMGVGTTFAALFAIDFGD
jgi:hypothetical protein